MTSDPPGPFISSTFNRADAARNAVLRENVNDHISALGDAFAVVWREAIEAAAAVIDECNREGPYQAIGAADRIRALLDAPETIREEPSRAPDRELLLALARFFASSFLNTRKSWTNTGAETGLVQPVEYGVWEVKPTEMGRRAIALVKETPDAG
jgi:hypothetical protein